MKPTLSDTVRLWFVPVDVADADLTRYYGVLDEVERGRAAALRHEIDRRRFVAAHGALRFILGGELDAPPREIRWVLGRHGKPPLDDQRAPAEVNLSHSGAFALVGIAATRPIGVDVQHLVPAMDASGMATRFFPPDEARFVSTAGDVARRADRFAHLWARKEAVVKAGAGRLWRGLDMPVRGDATMLVWYEHGTPPGIYRLSDVPAPPGYRAAVALAGDAPYVVDVRRWGSMAATER